MNSVIFTFVSTTLFLWTICSSQETDIRECAEVQIRNANLHPALNGFYQRTQETYNNLPVFQGSINNKIRYIWWNQYDEFSRWSIGTDKFSSSIEGFMDNKKNEAWMLGNGRSWHVVNEHEWTIDRDFNVVCSRTLQQQQQQMNNNNNNNGGEPPRGGRPPQRRKAQQTKVIKVNGARNNALNQFFYAMNQEYDGQTVYKTDGNDRPIYIFHYSYDEMQRWYIGTTLGSDYDVLAFIEDVNHNLSKDGITQIWSEHDGGSKEWNDNANMKVVLQDNVYQNYDEQKAPPLQREIDEHLNNRRRMEQQNNNNNQNDGQQQAYERNPGNQKHYDPPPRNNDRRQRNNQRNEQRNEQRNNEQYQRQNDQEKARSAEEERNERRRQMFRRVNKLDLEVESSGKFESGINVQSEPDIIITGSDDMDINAVYFVQPVKYNERNVYKSTAGSYLYYVRYTESDAARWQIGSPNGGVKNDQPIAFVNADVEFPYDIATWQAWLVFNKQERDWVRQSKVNTYRGDCYVEILGAFNADINGRYGIMPQTHESRPVFEKHEDGKRINLFFSDEDSQYSKWFIARPNGNYLDKSDFVAFIPSSALTVDGVSDFETWQELNNGQLIENNELKVTGTCSKVKEHDWKRRRRQRAEERKRRKAMDAAKDHHCPNDMTVNTDPGRDDAVVHWQAYNGESVAFDEFDVVYSDNSVAPGSVFKMGRSAVTYELRDKNGAQIAKCDFIITVQDTEPPQIQCPGDIYIMTDYNQDTAQQIKWLQPEVFDNSGNEVQLQQIGGPKQGQTLKVGQYMISYEAKDLFGNSEVCNFGLYIVDRQSPKISACPEDADIAVYEDQNYAAFPEWDVPTAWDNVDGTNVNIQQINGPRPGSELRLDPGESERLISIVYEAADSSNNAARCAFNIRLIRDESAGERNVHHEEYHDKISHTHSVEESEEEYLRHLEEEEQNQDDEWSEKARRLREERELQNEERRKKAAARNRRRGHHSSVHEEHQRSEVHDFEASLLAEDALRDETNDNEQTKQKMTRAERRKKRREDRQKRRRDRARKRKEERQKRGDRSSGQNVFSIIFWSTLNFFYALIRPWVWPWFCLIPLLMICFACVAYGLYTVYDEMNIGNQRRGRRAPKYNSWSYKLANMFNRKTMKQRV